MKPTSTRTARLALLLLIPVLALVAPAAAREPAATLIDLDAGTRTESQWLSVHLGGRKVGHARTDRMIGAERVITSQHMSFELGRGDTPVSMSTDETHEETPEGEPLAFTGVSRISGLEMRVEGRRTRDGHFAIRSGSVDHMRDGELAWPDGALLAWGLERRLRETGTEAGARATLSAFQTLLQAAVELDYQVVGPSTIDTPNGPAELIETVHRLGFPGGAVASRVWMNEDLELQRMTMDIMGQTLELVACDRACAEAPNQPAEILMTSLIQSPRHLDPRERSQALEIDLRSQSPLSGWPGVDGQQLRRVEPGRYHLRTRQFAAADPMPPPGDRDLERTDWLDFDADNVRALLTGLEPRDDPDQRMRDLQHLVARHIETKNLRIGYASASDAARLREGDCTEHAVLLAALARASGVPARVVTGLAYTDEFAGTPSFVPHAWVAAWTGDDWRAYDAALPGAGQLRLAMHADDGDPWRFYDGLNSLGQLRIDEIRAFTPVQ